MTKFSVTGTEICTPTLEDHRCLNCGFIDEILGLLARAGILNLALANITLLYDIFINAASSSRHFVPVFATKGKTVIVLVNEKGTKPLT